MATTDEAKILAILNEVLPGTLVTLALDVFCRTSEDDDTEVVVMGIFAYDETLGVRSAEESDVMDVDTVPVS